MDKPKVEDYTLRTSTGVYIRKATRVIYPDGRTVSFMDKLPKKEAIKQAAESTGAVLIREVIEDE